MKDNHSFKKSSRLLYKKEFQEVSSSRDKFVGQLLVINILKTNTSEAKLGITVTKKFGKAYLRNRFKRKIREAFRLLNIPPGLCLHIKPKLPCHDVHSASMNDIQKEILSTI